MSPPRKATRGFSLIQISILLTVASLLMVAVLPTPQSTVRNNAGSVTKMSAVLTALRQYQAATCSLPCPADPTLPIGTVNYGRAAANPGTAGNCIGGSPAAAYADTTKHIAIGMVPIYTIGLSYDYALDGWGRDITYAVDTGATSNSTGTAAITINDFGMTQNSVVALISHGQDGYGAWLPLAGSSGTASRFDNGSTDNSQADNAQVVHGGGLTANGNGAFASFVNQNQSATFDDMVIYRSNLWNINAMPAILKATITPPANGTYSSGQVLTFTITSASTITVTGTPRLALTALGTGHLGNNVSPYISYATYNGGTGTKTITFTYTIQSGDSAPVSGISMNSSIDLNGGTATISPCLPFTAPDLSKVLISNVNIWIADANNNRALKLDANGNFIQGFGSSYNGDNHTVGSSGTSDQRLAYTDSVITDSSGNVWIADSGNDRVMKFNSSGQWLMTIGGKYNEACGGTYVNATTCNPLPASTDGGVSRAAGTTCCAPNASSCTCSSGSAKGQFSVDMASGPQQVTFDNGGNLWVTDYGNGRVQEFKSSTGAYMGSFSVNCTSGIAIDTSNTIWTIGSCGGGLKKCTTSGSCTTLSTPSYGCNWCSDYVTIDPNTGNVWVNDQNNGAVFEWNSSGTYLGQLSNPHTSTPEGVFYDSSGNIWIADDSNNNIYKINPSNSNLLQTIGTGASGTGTNPVQFNTPQEIFISSR